MFDTLLQFKGFESHDTGYYCGLWRDAQKLNLSNQTVSKDKPNQNFYLHNLYYASCPPYLLLAKGIVYSIYQQY